MTTYSIDFSHLEPSHLWANFSLLNAIPRASKKEEKVIKFMVKFGVSLGLKTIVDPVGNVIIKKAATPGMENRIPVVLQSHLDMVHQKNSDTVFDFDSQGIEMIVEGDWIKANGTTLGADNGIGVASIMSILASSDIEHPAIEALFTIDEETGMTGAKNLQPALLSGKILLNLDTEDDRELTIGCAGGIDVSANSIYQEEEPNKDQIAFDIMLTGLTGGHSGTEIHLGRANANKLLNRVLLEACDHLNCRIHRIDGGGLRNAIPRESTATIYISKHQNVELSNLISRFNLMFHAEYHTTDPSLQLNCNASSKKGKVISLKDQKNILNAIQACPNGIFRMSPYIDGLVQSSNNLARILMENGEFEAKCLTRSSVETEKMDVALSIRSAFELAGANVQFTGSYPGWKPEPRSQILRIMKDLYQESFQSEPNVNACHAGLECGIIGEHYPSMEMISFGPNIKGAHSPDEKVQISSVQKYWGYLLKILKNIPNDKV